MPVNYKNYHPLWKFISKFVRRLKAQNRCEQCGVRNYSVGYRDKDGSFRGACGNIVLDLAGNGQRHPSLDDLTYKEACGFRDALNEAENCFADTPVKYIVMVLTVAHMDHDIDNNELDNLQALCQKCHNDYDQPHRIANRKKKKNQLTIEFDKDGT